MTVIHAQSHFGELLRRRAQDRGTATVGCTSGPAVAARGDGSEHEAGSVAALAQEAQSLLTRIGQLAAAMIGEEQQEESPPALPLDDRPELIRELFGGVEPRVFFMTSDGQIVTGPLRTNVEVDLPPPPAEATEPGLIFSGWTRTPFLRTLPLRWDSARPEQPEEGAIEPELPEPSLAPEPPVQETLLQETLPQDEQEALLLRQSIARQRQQSAIGSMR